MIQIIRLLNKNKVKQWVLPQNLNDKINHYLNNHKGDMALLIYKDCTGSIRVKSQNMLET